MITLTVEVTVETVRVTWSDPPLDGRIAGRLAEEIGVAVVQKLGPAGGWGLSGGSFGTTANEQRWERVWDTPPETKK